MTYFAISVATMFGLSAIAKIAMAWWIIATKSGHSFDICSFITDILAKRLLSKGKLQIKFYGSEEDLSERACVTFNPLTLHIVEKIWRDAGMGIPYARFILAHEIGHIVLHNEFAVAFSEDKAAQLKYLQNEESSEWQANMFAGFFLVPDHVALKLADADVIAGLCVVADELAKNRLADAKNAKSVVAPPYTGEMCPKCQGFTLLRAGISTKCDACGATDPSSKTEAS
jgi:hypothetical protein